MGRGEFGAVPLTTIVPLLTLSFLLATSAQCGLEDKLARLVDTGGVHVEDLDGKVLLSWRGDELGIPASVLKLATAAFVLETLHPETRLTTEFVYDRKTKTLQVKGFGDPFLVSDELRIVVDSLIVLGVDEISSLIADCSNFKTPISIDGRGSSFNPYDAGMAALAVNFNTIVVDISTDGTVHRGEPETPLTPSAVELGRRFGKSGLHRLPIRDGERAGPLYALELFRALLREKGLEVGETMRQGEFTAEEPTIYLHKNRLSIEEMVAGMLEYSNNLVANSLLMAAALEINQEPVSLEDSALLLELFVRNRLDARSAVIKEGSGLSRRNLMTPRDIVRILHSLKVRGWGNLLPIYDGTRAKSGTLLGISCLAGYLALPNGRTVCFSLLLEGGIKSRDRVLDLIKRERSLVNQQMIQ